MSVVPNPVISSLYRYNIFLKFNKEVVTVKRYQMKNVACTNFG